MNLAEHPIPITGLWNCSTLCYKFPNLLVNINLNGCPKLAEVTILSKQKIKSMTIIRENINEKHMASEAEIEINSKKTKKLRILGLHGFRTSGEIFNKQISTKWPHSVLQNLDIYFPDAPFPAGGKSDVEGIFDPPYYEWFQFNQDYSEYPNLDVCLQFIEDLMIKHGPFDGLIGFSQGAILSGALPGLQANGVALTKVPRIKFVIIVGGAKFNTSSSNNDKLANSYPLECPSLHFLGEMDFLKPHGLELLKSCIDPIVIHHPKAHTVPRLDEESSSTMHSFLEKMQNAETTK